MDLLLDNNNDLDLTDNKLSFTTTSSQIVRQRMQLTLHMNIGEWLFNTQIGLPWISKDNEEQLIGKNDKSYVDSIIRDEVRKIDGVVDVLSFNSHLDNTTRSYTLQAQVRLIDNTTVKLFEEIIF